MLKAGLGVRSVMCNSRDLFFIYWQGGAVHDVVSLLFPFISKPNKMGQYVLFFFAGGTFFLFRLAKIYA